MTMTMKTCEMCGKKFKGNPKDTLCRKCKEKRFAGKVDFRPLKHPVPSSQPEPHDPHEYARKQIAESLRVHDAAMRTRKGKYK
jgi:ribosome-binding protein aMBF1 (putative translation factor)